MNTTSPTAAPTDPDTPATAPAGGEGGDGRGTPMEFGHVPILDQRIDTIWPSPENEKLYRPISPTDPQTIAQAESIREVGFLEPIVVTQDRWVVSGHRRYVAAQMLRKKTVPVRVLPIRRDCDYDLFVLLLREFNRQRLKTRDELLREEVLAVSPEDAYQTLLEYRKQQAIVHAEKIQLRGRKRRAAISAAKAPMLDAVCRILEDRRKFWPFSDRRLHYILLNDPPLRHAKKPGSVYENTSHSYKSLVDLLTRARLEGEIPWEALADETRPVTVWNVHRDVQGFLRTELRGFLKGYWRDLLQSQPNHIEIVGEKNTIGPIIQPAAADYCIPMTLGRGFCSLAPRHAMAERFRQSGKERLVVLLLSDFDPDGEEIAHSFARSMRDDFGIEALDPLKVALTAEQVARFKLPPKMKAKPKSVNYGRFVEKHGDDVFELEALDAVSAECLQDLLREAIDSVVDTRALNAEIDHEKKDAEFLAVRRHQVWQVLHHELNSDMT